MKLPLGFHMMQWLDEDVLQDHKPAKNEVPGSKEEGRRTSLCLCARARNNLVTCTSGLKEEGNSDSKGHAKAHPPKRAGLLLFIKGAAASGAL